MEKLTKFWNSDKRAYIYSLLFTVIIVIFLSLYCIFIHLGIIISGIGIAISILRSMDICRGRYFPKAICCIHGARCWG